MQEHKNTLNSSEVIARLFQIIINISEENRRQLLKVLEKNIQSKFSLRRKHPRQPYKVNVDFTIDEIPFSFFTHNVSKNGLFIETDLPFLNNKKLSLEFKLPRHADPIKAEGKIVRTSPAGIGVKFSETLTEL